jgi:adenosylmethionine-8-amino-7-oxononanoate aminotransferase
LANIEIIERDGLLDHVRRVAPLFQSRLAGLNRHGAVGDARGIGLVGCVEGLPAGPDTSLDQQRTFGYRLDKVCEEMGLLVRPLINMCVFSPALVITEDEIGQMMDILDAALARVTMEMAG